MRYLLMLVLSTITLSAQQYTSIYVDNTNSVSSIADLAGDLQNGHVYCGSVRIIGSHNELFVMRRNAINQTMWSVTFPDTLSVAPTSIGTNNNGIYVVGIETDTSTGISQGFVMKLDYNGNLVWRNTTTAVTLNNIALTTSGNLIAVGHNCIVSFDDTGSLLWSHNINLSAPNLHYDKVTIDDDGFIYLLGSVGGPSFLTYGVITKYDSIGNHVWSRQYSGNSMPFCWRGAVWNESELLGYAWFMVPAGINGVFYPIYITRMDTSGTILQSFCSPISSTNPENFYTSDALLLDSNTLVIGGIREDSPMLFKFDLNSFTMTSAVDMPFTSYGRINAIARTNDSLIAYCGLQCQGINCPFQFGQIDTSLTAMCGWVSFTTGTGPLNATPQNTTYVDSAGPTSSPYSCSAVPINFILDSCFFTGINVNDLISFSIQALPNPSRGECKVKLSRPSTEDTPLTLYNSLGEVVASRIIRQGESEVMLQLQGIGSGIYFIHAPGFAASTLEIIQD